MLGVCHDSGYATELQTKAPNEEMSDRVTLLKGYQVAREFTSLRFQTTRFTSLFREERFPVQHQPLSHRGADKPILLGQVILTQRS